MLRGACPVRPALPSRLPLRFRPCSRPRYRAALGSPPPPGGLEGAPDSSSQAVLIPQLVIVMVTPSLSVLILRGEFAHCDC